MRSENNGIEKIGVVGTGKVGRVLARLFSKAGTPVLWVADRSLEKAKSCAVECGAKSASSNASAFDPLITVLLLCVADDDLPALAYSLGHSGKHIPGMLAVHTSGALGASVLEPMRALGVLLGSFHPCYSFADPFEGDLQGVRFAIEGDLDACIRMEALSRILDGKPIRMSSDDKVLYHTACSMASNHLVGLLDAIDRILRHTGIDEGIEALWPLVRGTIRNAESLGVAQALTGPILRGDVATVKQHLEALAVVEPSLLRIYTSLGQRILMLALQRGLDQKKASDMQRLLDSFSLEKTS